MKEEKLMYKFTTPLHKKKNVWKTNVFNSKEMEFEFLADSYIRKDIHTTFIPYT